MKSIDYGIQQKIDAKLRMYKNCGQAINEMRAHLNSNLLVTKKPDPKTKAFVPIHATEQSVEKLVSGLAKKHKNLQSKFMKAGVAAMKLSI